jgi:hypothetical protein
MKKIQVFSIVATSVLALILISSGCHRHPPIVVPPQPPPPLVSIVRTAPANGETEVAVTRETIIEFALPIKATGVTAANFSAQFGEDTLAANVRLSPDRKRVTCSTSNRCRPVCGCSDGEWRQSS